MLASLPMYDWPETRAITDLWWQALRKALIKEGVTSAPFNLVRHTDDHHNWKSSNLIVGQTCGYPFTHGYSDHLKILGIPDYKTRGCQNFQYQSLILCHKDQTFVDLESFRNKKAAINDVNSQSGYSAFRHSIAPLANGGPFFKEVIHTGGHRFSLKALSLGEVDICAVDPVSFALAERYVPDLVASLQIVTLSAPAPCLPLVCHRFIEDDLYNRIQQALFTAFDDPTHEDLRQQLFLNGINKGYSSDYQRIITMENEAYEWGYSELE